MTAPTTPVLAHTRLSWGGTLGAAAEEIWSNAINIKHTGEPPSAQELLALAQAAAPLLGSLISGNPAQVTPAAVMTWVKAVYVLSSGKQRDVNTALYEVPIADRQKGSGAYVPWVQTFAITLRSVLDRGRGHAGRIFPPPCGPNPEGGGPYAPAAFATNLASYYASIFSNIRATFNGILDPGATGGDSNGRYCAFAIVSRATERQPTPLLTEITRAVVDRVVDVQHRRVNRVARSEGAPAAFV